MRQKKFLKTEEHRSSEGESPGERLSPRQEALAPRGEAWVGEGRDLPTLGTEELSQPLGRGACRGLTCRLGKARGRADPLLWKGE